MDLKQLAAERLRQLLRDATGQEPGKWRHGMQQRVAELLGVHASLISTTEHGGRDRLGLEALGKIQDKTGISPMYFIVDNIIAGATYRDFLAPGRKDPFREFRPEDDGTGGIVITAETLLQKADDLQRLADQLRTEAQQHGRAISSEGRQAVSRSLTPPSERQRPSTTASEPRRLAPPRHASPAQSSPRPKPGAARSKN